MTVNLPSADVITCIHQTKLFLTMKNLRLNSLWVLALLALACYSCNNDDDSPSNASLLIGTWEIVAENGGDVDYDLELRFDADGGGAN